MWGLALLGACDAEAWRLLLGQFRAMPEPPEQLPEQALTQVNPPCALCVRMCAVKPR